MFKKICGSIRRSGFDIMYRILVRDVDTVWGKHVRMFHRENTNDSLVIHSVMIHNEYMVDNFLYEDNDVFIDIGAHIGTWSILMAIYNPTFKVYSYEAVPENVEMIKKNIELNELTNIKPFNLAVSDCSEGKETIYYTTESPSDRWVGSPQGGKEYIEIERISLNDILNNVNHCKVLKMDCEGCEVKGFKTITEENIKKIDYVIGEFHPWGIGFDTFFSYFKGCFMDLSNTFGKEKMGTEPFSLQRFMFGRIK